MMSNVAVSVHVLCTKLRGQQLTVRHQSRGPSAAPPQMLQVVDWLIRQRNKQIYSIIIYFMFALFLVWSVWLSKWTSKACWILSLLPARPGRLELKECVFSEICPPSRLSSGSRVSDHNLHTPSSQDVSSTLHTEPLKNNKRMQLSITTSNNFRFWLISSTFTVKYSIKTHCSILQNQDRSQCPHTNMI